MNDGIDRLVELVRHAECIACLTGAGMSTESGIPDFRSSSGFYQTTATERTFDIDLFDRDPGVFYRESASLVSHLFAAQPNAGHFALAALERLGKRVAIATQNIDALHQRAGSAEVYELHGTMRTFTCRKCGARLRVKNDHAASLFPDSATVDFADSGPESRLERKNREESIDVAELAKGNVLRHVCGGVLKPDVVFFGESLPESAIAGTLGAMQSARLVLVLGTGLTVYPAAGFTRERAPGVPLVIVNRSETPQDDEAALVIRDSIGSILPQVVERLAASNA